MPLSESSAEREVLEAATALLALLEADYYYDEVNVKRVIADADACEICIDAEDRGWIEDDDVFDGVFGDEDGPPLHPNAVLASSTFAPYGRLNRMVSAEFDGVAIELNAGENGTTIGPNHPMLTSRGLLQAKFIQIGDQLIYDRRAVNLSQGAHHPNLDQIHLVENVFESYFSSCPNAMIPASTHDFHGDIVSRQEKVRAVFPDRVLLDELDGSALQSLPKGNLMLPDTHLSAEADLCSFEKQLRRFLLSPACCMSGCCIGQFSLLTVKAIRIVHIKTRAFDASTASGWYCSDGFVVSNCGCSLEYGTKRKRVYA